MGARFQESKTAALVDEPSRLEQNGEALFRQTMLEGRWQVVLEDSTINILPADLSGRILFTNPTLQQMLGYSEPGSQSFTFCDMSHEEQREAISVVQMSPSDNSMAIRVAMVAART